MKDSDYIERRLHPSQSMPEFFTLCHLLNKIAEIVSILERSAWEFPLSVLDAGAGCAPYRSLFAPARFQYTAVDAQTLPGLAAVTDGERLPFQDGVFDLVLSNQVLEHVRNPRAICEELKRVLNNRGYLLLSCPFVWEIHNFPADYWRFSEQALQLLFEDMDVVYIEPSTSTAQCLVQTFNLFIDRNLKSEGLKASLFRLANSRLVLAGLPKRDTLLPTNYVLVAKKKAPAAGSKALSGPAIERDRFRMHLETPASHSRMQSSTVTVSGWIAGDLYPEQVHAQIDGSETYRLSCNLQRLDVWRAFPQFRNAHRSGFRGECRIDSLQAGEHSLEIVAELQSKTLAWDAVRFKVGP